MPIGTWQIVVRSDPKSAGTVVALSNGDDRFIPIETFAPDENPHELAETIRRDIGNVTSNQPTEYHAYDANTNEWVDLRSLGPGQLDAWYLAAGSAGDVMCVNTIEKIRAERDAPALPVDGTTDTCRNCGEEIEYDSGNQPPWTHTETIVSDCGDGYDGFHAEPTT